MWDLFDSLSQCACMYLVKNLTFEEGSELMISLSLVYCNHILLFLDFIFIFMAIIFKVFCLNLCFLFLETLFFRLQTAAQYAYMDYYKA